jgi:hypothetical protein
MLIIRFGYTLKNKAAGGKKQHGIMKGKKTLVFSRSSTLLWPPTIGKRLTSPQGAQQQQQSHVGRLIQIQRIGKQIISIYYSENRWQDIGSEDRWRSAGPEDISLFGSNIHCKY